jgi:hypothetical protein
MNNLINYDDFLLESKGISDITLEYKNMIWKDLKNMISEYEKEQTKYGKIFTKIFNEKYNFDNTLFKIKNLQLNIKILKYHENVCNGIIYNKDCYIDDNNFLNNLIINLEIYVKNFDNIFLIEVESLLLHEMVHGFQIYKSIDKSVDSNWLLGSMIPNMRNMIKNDSIKNILYLLYRSLKHELSAQIHQYYDYKLKSEKYEKIFTIISLFENFNPCDISINDENIKDLNIIRRNYINNLEDESPNNLYFRNVNFNWKKEITKDNIQKFLLMLNDIFKKSVKYLENKIKLVDNKLQESEIFKYTHKTCYVFAEIMSYKKEL